METLSILCRQAAGIFLILWIVSTPALTHPPLSASSKIFSEQALSPSVILVRQPFLWARAAWTLMMDHWRRSFQTPIADENVWHRDFINAGLRADNIPGMLFPGLQTSRVQTEPLPDDLTLSKASVLSARLLGDKAETNFVGEFPRLGDAWQSLALNARDFLYLFPFLDGQWRIFLQKNSSDHLDFAIEVKNEARLNGYARVLSLTLIRPGTLTSPRGGIAIHLEYALDHSLLQSIKPDFTMEGWVQKKLLIWLSNRGFNQLEIHNAQRDLKVALQSYVITRPPVIQIPIASFLAKRAA